MSRNGRDSDKHVFSSMDGVSVKISEHFKPPPKVGLPAGYQQRLSAEMFIEDYDFKLEHSVLEKMAEWRQLRRSLAASRREAKLSEPQTSDEPSPVNHPCPASPVAPSSHFNPRNDTILTPVQIVQPSSTANTSRISQFNFSDFEADTSSPFDNMELKTINEMEVLAHVLRPSTKSPDTNQNVGPSWSGYKQDVRPPWSGYKQDEFWPRGEVEMSERHGKVPMPVEGLNISPVRYAVNRFNHSQSIPIKKYNDSTQCNQAASKSQSRSVPDIVQQLDQELQSKMEDRNTESQSLRPNSYDSTGLENWKPWPSLDSPQHPGAKKGPRPARASTLANPFNELSGSAQALVRHISEMGFDLPRAARACQSVGQDDKKIVEYLLAIQFMEEADFHPDSAERAFVANGFQRSKAVSHLEAMNQLLDLGFQEPDIFDALVRFDNDRDKALDHLIA